MFDLVLYRRRIVRFMRRNNILIMVLIVIALFSYTLMSTKHPAPHRRHHRHHHGKGLHSHHANNPVDLLDGMVGEHLDHHNVKDNEPLPGDFERHKLKETKGRSREDWLKKWNEHKKQPHDPVGSQINKIHDRDRKRKMNVGEQESFRKSKKNRRDREKRVVLYQGENDRGTEVSKEIYLGVVKFPPYVKYGTQNGPGEKGRQYKIDKESLSPEELEERNNAFQDHYFDEFVSQKIAIHRTLEDTRPDACRHIDISDIPAASVIIVFHNEAWTVLLRTLHSILDRTPKPLLREIILLDDDSDMEHLGIPLQGYIQRMPNIRLIRAPGRLGLIRARNVAVTYARADTVVFLDSHIECFNGWLEPLLAAIQTDRRTLAYPQIEFISSSTFGLQMSGQPQVVGGFYPHTLSFGWLYKRKLNITSRAENHPSPTMPGGLYAISKAWFMQLGGYDPGLKLWGGENMEMSFKAWMCGGSIVLISCSHVGHVFRTRNPTLGPGVNIMDNSIRVAEVWLDRFKHFFYERVGYHLGNFGDVSDRKSLRENLQCHDFRWYLDHVYPEMKEDMDPNALYGGRIINSKSGLCLERKNKIYLGKCLGYVYIQMWQMSHSGEMQTGDKYFGVATYPKENQELAFLVRLSDKSLVSSAFDAHWQYDEHLRLVHVKSGRCLVPDETETGVTVTPCGDNEIQKWNFEKRVDVQEALKNEGKIKIDWSV